MSDGLNRERPRGVRVISTDRLWHLPRADCGSACVAVVDLCISVSLCVRDEDQ